MDLYVDTGDPAAVRAAAERGVLDGVTTNPSLVAATHRSYREVVAEAADLIDGPVFAQVVADDADGMVEEGLAYDGWADEVVVKLPMTPAGVRALDRLRHRDVSAGTTVVFAVEQVLLAAKAGATFVAPYVGRLEDDGADGGATLAEMRAVLDRYGYETDLLAASLRTRRHVREALAAGADAATLPPDLLSSCYEHHKTEEGLAGFAADWGDRGSPIE